MKAKILIALIFAFLACTSCKQNYPAQEDALESNQYAA